MFVPTLQGYWSDRIVKSVSRSSTPLFILADTVTGAYSLRLRCWGRCSRLHPTIHKNTYCSQNQESTAKRFPRIYASNVIMVYTEDRAVCYLVQFVHIVVRATLTLRGSGHSTSSMRRATSTHAGQPRVKFPFLSQTNHHR